MVQLTAAAPSKISTMRGAATHKNKMRTPFDIGAAALTEDFAMPFDIEAAALRDYFGIPLT